MGCTCGEPDEIELTAIGVELNGSRRVPLLRALVQVLQGLLIHFSLKKSGKHFRVGIFLGFASSSTRTMHPHGAYVQVSGRNRVDPPIGWN